jgi:hypothetical protein
MQHFVSFQSPLANFVRLTDSAINKARQLTQDVKSGALNTGWAGLSGFNPNNPAAVHDNLQHRLIDKTIYKASTGENPNQYFRNGSLQQRTKLMPLVQGKNISRNKKALVNETIEKLVDTASVPYSYMKQNYEPDQILPVDTRPLMPYLRNKFSDGDRLAGTQISNKLFKQNPDIDNSGFRQKYIQAMQEDEFLRKPINIKLESEKKQNLATPASKLRAKLKDRQNYSDVFDTSKYETVDQYIDRNRLLDAYRNKGLMPR